ncbi:TonB-dependent receptor [Maribacter algarum]|uniref:TonB-dependent receptor n=1 Tax=Maribacter algarum (ex Zhang et al. 2020) TaxID=2578118 RepID=A0A5S3PQ75_9FLAO|nr:TonB-dependent receptor [Maribacter algarum]TMM55815.1 TonB-dependent receptor [Maribacter algarum]
MKNSIQKQDYFKVLLLSAVLLLTSFSVFAQEGIVSGTVNDASGATLPGVNVVVKNTSTGAITDFDGNYSITIPEGGETLVFSYVGYKTQEIAINGQSTINAVLAEGSFGLEEVVVTSRKQSENVQEVPISVSAFSAKTLEARGIENVSGIADFIPNVEIDVTAPFSGSQSVLSPYIRGIGQIDFAITYEPAVGLYVDGVYFGRTVGSIIDLLDVERVEALKGPQGTLFGRNTIAGALNITTKDPSRTFSATGQLTTGNFNRLDTKVSVDIPLVEDKLLSSFSVSSINRDGHMKRVPYTGPANADLASPRGGVFSDVNLDGEQGNQNNDTWRAKLKWLASEKFQATFSGDYERVRENQNASKILAMFNDVGGAPTIVGAYNACAAGLLPPELCDNIANAPGLTLTGSTPYDERFITDDPFTNYGTADAGTKIDTWGASMTLDWELSDKLAFKSISGYRNLQSRFAEDQDFSPLDFGTAGFIMPQKQFTQEFQLVGNSDKLKWIGGLYYFTEKGSVTDQVILGNGLVQIYGQNFVKNKSYAAFAQATYNLSEKWSVTAGARLTNERKELDGRQRDLNSFALKTGVVSPADFPTTDLTLYYPPGVNEQTFSEPTFRLGTEYKFSENVFAYGFFAQGFKSGGWTTRVTSPVLEAPTFEPEKANTYELGLKTDLADNTFRFNIAAFYTDYQNLQITVQRGITPFVENAAQATIKGLEVDAQWRASENLTFSGNLGFIDASYNEITDPNAVIQEDFSFVNTPDFSSSLAMDWIIPFGENKGRLIFHTDLSSKSEIYNDVENTPLLLQDGITLLNASLSLESASRAWKISMGGTNITDQTYLVGGYNNPGVGIIYGTYARPAEFNLGITYKLFSNN